MEKERCTVMTRITRILAIGVALATTTLLTAKTQLIPNGSMESGAGPFGIDKSKAADWTFFSGGERNADVNLVPAGLGHSFKAWGQAGTVGAFQDVTVAPGEQVVVNVQLRTISADPIGGDAEAGLKLEWVDASQTAFGGSEVFVLNGSSPVNTWIPATRSGTAPINAVAARITLVFRYTSTAQGSAYWDDAEMIIGGIDELLNGDFEGPGQAGEINSTGIDEWLGFGFQKKMNTHSLDGLYSVEVTGSPAGVQPCDYCGLYTDGGGDIVGGDHVYYQSYAYNPTPGGLSGTAVAGTKIEFYPPAGVELAPPVENLAFDSTAPTDVWQQVSVSTVVPPDMTGMRLVVLFFDNSDPNIPSGPIYVDDVTATINGLPVTLDNPSFEAALGFTWDRFFEAACTPVRTSELPAEHQGAWSVRIPTGCTAGLIAPTSASGSPPIAVVPGQTVQLNAWFLHRASNPQNDPNSRAGVKIQWSLGGVPQHIDIGGATNTITASAPTNAWSLLTIDSTMPTGVEARTRFTTILARGNSAGSTVYFDNCEALILNRFNGSDADNDEDQDLRDFAQFQRAFTGSGGPMKYLGLVFDNHPSATALGDNDVDASDWAYLEPRMTPPGP